MKRPIGMSALSSARQTRSLSAEESLTKQLANFCSKARFSKMVIFSAGVIRAGWDGGEMGVGSGGENKSRFLITGGRYG